MGYVILQQIYLENGRIVCVLAVIAYYTLTIPNKKVYPFDPNNF